MILLLTISMFFKNDSHKDDTTTHYKYVFQWFQHPIHTHTQYAASKLMTVGDVPIKSNHDFKKKRRQILLRILEEREFDVVLIEMYPFGRRAFKFEIKPFLNKIRSLPIRPAVLCSVRDVLVKTCDPTKHMGAFRFYTSILSRKNNNNNNNRHGRRCGGIF